MRVTYYGMQQSPNSFLPVLLMRCTVGLILIVKIQSEVSVKCLQSIGQRSRTVFQTAALPDVEAPHIYLIYHFR